MISPEALVRRARKGCEDHRDRVNGICQECLLAEIERAIPEAHPELKRDDVFELVQEWLMQEDESFH